MRMPISRVVCLGPLLGWALFVSRPLSAQSTAAPAITPGVERAVVESLAQTLVRVYVDADTGRMIAERLRAREREGAYRQLADADALANALSTDLRLVNGDKHLSVQYAPGAPVDRLGPHGIEFAGGGEDSVALEANARGAHYGLGKLELLPGNIGYAELTGFFDGAGSERMMLAALTFLEGADAIILDLRGHGGGSGEMSNWLLSHFLRPDSLLTLRVHARVSNETTDRYTLARVDGPRRPEVPLFVLTGRGTASAAEDFTFVLKNLGRIVVVGDRTAGAGHNNTFLGVGHGFTASISFTRVTDPASGREWERVGIPPDLAVPVEQALEAAHLAALDTLEAHATGPAATRLALLKESVVARYTPREVPAALLQAYAGVYGVRSFTARNGRLWYRRGDNPPRPLIAISDSVFTLEGVPGSRFAFAADTTGMMHLHLRQPDGQLVEVPRE